MPVAHCRCVAAICSHKRCRLCHAVLLEKGVKHGSTSYLRRPCASGRLMEVIHLLSKHRACCSP